MQHPLWDDEMKFELFRFRSELRTENIRVLAEPVGLGLIKRENQGGRSLYPQLAHQPLTSEMVSAKNINPKTPAVAAAPNYPQPREMPAAAPQASPIPPIANTEEIMQPPRRQSARRPSRLLFLLLSHCLDLGFVGLCLGLGFIVLGFVIDPSNMSLHPDTLLQALPLQVLKHVQGWALLIGVYVVFSCYWLFFRFVSGATLGETCLQNFNHSEEGPRPAPVKGSGDS